MKGRLKVAVIFNALVLAMTTPAWADSLDPSFERDMRMAFEIDGQPMELALLSEQEMAETKGAVWPFVIPWITRAFWGGMLGKLLNGYEMMDDSFDGYKAFYQCSGTQVMLHCERPDGTRAFRGHVPRFLSKRSRQALQFGPHCQLLLHRQRA